MVSTLTVLAKYTCLPSTQTDHDVVEIVFQTEYKQDLCENTLQNCKPYWTHDLTRVWRDVVKSEMKFSNSPKTCTNRSDRRECFKQKQLLFDKALRNAERAYNRRFADEVKELNTSNPQMSWSYINRLGPRKPKDIPLKIYNKNNTETDVFDNGFLSEELHEKNTLETGYHAVDHSDTPSGYGYEYLNMPFSLENRIKLCGKMKNGKSVCPDLLPNEVFVLLKFMNNFFELSLVPGSWQQAIIAPFPRAHLKTLLYH